VPEDAALVCFGASGRDSCADPEATGNPSYFATGAFSMLITPAFAQADPAALGGGGMLVQFLPFVLIFVIMYFLILRPQQKRVKTHQEMIKNLRRGDTVVTSGGIIGRITRVTDEGEVQVEIAEGVKVRVARGMITDVRSKGEPVKEDSAS
jgi:preprotein translocase subunit YajC